VDLHVHFPDYQQKDGPSAGITMATSIASALMRIPVRRNVAQRAQVQVDSVRPRVNGPLAEDRQRWTHLIERARAGPGECLTPAALAAVMPIGVAGASGGRRPRTH